MNETQKLVDQLFSRALDLPAANRKEFLEQNCEGDEQLRERVEALLVAATASDSALSLQFDGLRGRVWQSVIDESEVESQDVTEDLSGQLIGIWLIEKLLARGGLASVYLARRNDGQFDQRVALKVLRRGLDTDDLISRFGAERRILAMLEHPKIAQIIDGGALEDGRPYLVMEFVDGTTITDYCRDNKLTTNDRVRLVAEVLEALHHAHQRLVVHRDIKPSNIMVTNDGRVVLLDFGIAKLLDTDGASEPLSLTRTGVVLLTPGYGSPEQHAHQSVTTVSDVYQTGLVLFELLSGERPPNDQAYNMDAPPLMPSSNFSKGTKQHKDLRGDLDAITRKASHLDPSRRYASANDMLVDLRNYLEQRPVNARPDNLWYRVTKRHQRQPWMMPVAIIGVLGIAAYITTLSLYSQRLEEERRLAVSAQVFMVDLFRSADPYAPADAERGRNITVVEALDIGRVRLQTELIDQPALRASLLASIAAMYGHLDQTQQAITLREEALELERMLFGNEAPQVQDSLRELGRRYTNIGDSAAATAAFDEQLKIARAQYSKDDPALGIAEVAAALHQDYLGDLESSTRLLKDGIKKLRGPPIAHPTILLNALRRMSHLVQNTDPQQALQLIDEAQHLAQSHFGSDSMQAMLVNIRQAALLSITGDYQRSLAIYQSTVPELEIRLGQENDNTLSAINNFALLYQRMGELSKAEDFLRDLLARRIAKHGPQHHQVASSYQNLATAISRQQRYDEAIVLHRRARVIYQSILHENNYTIDVPLLSIAHAQFELQQFEAAQVSASEALLIFQAHAPGTIYEGVAHCLVALGFQAQGLTPQAEQAFLLARAILKPGVVGEPYATLCI